MWSTNLGVEEAGHPEGLGASLEAPGAELCVSVLQLGDLEIERIC